MKNYTNIFKKNNKWMFRDTKTTPTTTLYRYNKIYLFETFTRSELLATL